VEKSEIHTNTVVVLNMQGNVLRIIQVSKLHIKLAEFIRRYSKSIKRIYKVWKGIPNSIKACTTITKTLDCVYTHTSSNHIPTFFN
jgi:hypothetical protein